MKKIKLVVYVAVITGLIAALQIPKFLLASSCHSSSNQEIEKKKSVKKRESRPVKITKIVPPPKLTVKGKMTCAGSFLFRKGYRDDYERCKNTAIIVKEVEECDKSGLPDCPYENKLFHILLNEKNKKLLSGKKFQNAEVSIHGRLYTEERVLEVLSFRLLSEEEIMNLEWNQ